jgi:molybdopterin molybdotransferase
MSGLRDDCFGIDDRLMPLDEALDILQRRLDTVAPVERVPLRQAAGRVLARDVVSAVTVPPHDNSAMDGYAVCFDDLVPGGETRLPIGGRIPAGQVFDRPARRGEALRIFTGAPMPEGADTVVMQEDARADGDAVVLAPKKIKRGDNRRLAGEDVRTGDVVISAGTRLRPQEVGIAAATGHAGLDVFARLRVAVFSTGDEVRDPPTPLVPGQIYDINRYTVSSLLEGLGCVVTDLGILPDERDLIRARLEDAAAGHDLLITSGGVSMGEEDHVKAAVQADGALHFWRLAIKPGRPVALGQVRGVPFVGLPGNPVASMVTFFVVARPVVLRLMGCPHTALPRLPLPAAFSFSKKPGRREFLRARLVSGPEGVRVDRFAADGSGILSSMTASDGLVDVPEDVCDVAPGDPVHYIPFAEVMR